MNESAVKINRTLYSPTTLFLLKLMTMFVQQQNATPSNGIQFSIDCLF